MNRLFQESLSFCYRTWQILLFIVSNYWHSVFTQHFIIRSLNAQNFLLKSKFQHALCTQWEKGRWYQNSKLSKVRKVPIFIIISIALITLESFSIWWSQIQKALLSLLSCPPPLLFPSFIFSIYFALLFRSK